MKPDDYRVITSSTPQELERKVRGCIGEGFAPTGPMYCAPADERNAVRHVYSQAVIRTASKGTPDFTLLMDDSQITDRIEDLVCAVGDLQRNEREFTGYAPPGQADFMDWHYESAAPDDVAGEKQT